MTATGRDRACIVGTGVAAFLVYAATACPTVPPGDSGELIAAAWTAGVPHPPGYPLYALVGWLWSHVLWPVGNVAWRLNLFSGVAMGSAVGFTVAGALRAGANRWSAVAAAAVFALATESWRAGVAAEVFAGHACFVAAIVWLLLRWARPTAGSAAPGRAPWVAALVLGLAGAHHQTALFLVPAVWFWTSAHRDRLGHALPKRAGLCIGIAAAAALLPYLVLMPLSARDDALVWGDLTSITDPTGYASNAALPESAQGAGAPARITTADYSGLGEGLVHHVRRQAYGPLLGSRAGSGIAPAGAFARPLHVLAWLWHYVRSGGGGLWLLGWLLAPLGAWRLWRTRADTLTGAKLVAPGFVVAIILAGSGGLGLIAAAAGAAVGLAVWPRATATPESRLAWFLVLAWFVSGPLFISYGVNFDAGDALRQAVVSRFFIMPAVPLTLLGAIGLTYLGNRFGVALARGVGAVAAGSTLVTALAGGASLAGVHSVEVYGRNLLASIPSTPPGGKPALLFVQGDVPNNAIDYLQYCELARPDVAMLNQQKLTYPWSVRRDKRRFGANPATAVDIPGERYDGRLVTNENLIRSNLARRRVYFFGIATGDTSYQRSYWRLPRGLVSEMVPTGTPLDPAAIERENLAVLNAFDWNTILTTPGDAYFLDEVRQAHANAWYELALFFHTGPNGTGTPVDHARAKSTYERALQLFPDHANTVLGYGLLLAQNLGDPAEAKPYLVRYLSLRPEDPRNPNIAQLAGVPFTPPPKKN